MIRNHFTTFLKHGLLAVLCIGLFSDCRPDDEVPQFVTYLLRITHKASGSPLVANQVYTDSSGQTYSVSKLNYFISNIKFRNKETGEYYHEVASYHLVNALRNPANAEIILRNVPRKKFSEMELSFGVDNSANHSTDNIGDLDPGNGMAWDWKTGYKFMELEGNYTSDGQSGSYLFHTGEDACFRTVTFSFKNLLSNDLDVVKDGQVIFDADIASAFGQPSPVDFKVFNNVMSASAGGAKIADNNARAFFKLVGAQ
jgi:hypothetical protein